MDFVELVFARLSGQAEKNDYIVWAEQRLEDGCDLSIVAELASCSWEANPEPNEIERMFQSCVAELGLVLPTDWERAFLDYTCSMCEKTIRGELAPRDCMGEMLELAEDNNDPYILWIWIDLAKELSAVYHPDAENKHFNGVLDLENSDECIRCVALQFISLTSIALPDKFPWIWQCQECGAFSEESTLTQDMSRNCTLCGSIESMKNMRFFENREAFIGKAT